MPPVGSHDLRQLDQVARADEMVGRVDQGRGNAEGAVFHRLAHDPSHRVELLLRGCALVHPLDVGPDGRGAHERAEVDRGSVALHGPEPVVESMRAGELRRAAGQFGIDQPGQPHRAIVGRCIRPALAHDLGRHTLRHLADEPAIALEQGSPGVTLDIHEARADNEPSGVNPFRGLRLLEDARPGDARDPSAPESHIAVEPGIARPIDDAAAQDHDVVGGFLVARGRDSSLGPRRLCRRPLECLDQTCQRGSVANLGLRLARKGDIRNAWLDRDGEPVDPAATVVEEGDE